MKRALLVGGTLAGTIAFIFIASSPEAIDEIVLALQYFIALVVLIVMVLIITGRFPRLREEENDR